MVHAEVLDARVRLGHLRGVGADGPLAGRNDRRLVTVVEGAIEPGLAQHGLEQVTVTSALGLAPGNRLAFDEVTDGMDQEENPPSDILGLQVRGHQAEFQGSLPTEMGAVEPVMLVVPDVAEVVTLLDALFLAIEFAAIRVVLARWISKEEEGLLVAAHEAHDALERSTVDAIHVHMDMKATPRVNRATLTFDDVHNLNRLDKLSVRADDRRRNLVTTGTIGLEIPVGSITVTVVTRIDNGQALLREFLMNPVQGIHGGGEFNLKSNLAE